MRQSKKRNYAYFLVPLVALIIFVAVYINFDKGYEAREAKKEADIRAQKEQEIEAQNKSREEAVKAAIADSARRKKEKAERDAAEQKKRDDRQAAFQRRDKAQFDAANLRDRAEKLRKDVQGLEEDIKKIQADKAELVVEREGVEQVAAKAAENARALNDVLEKIAAADRQAELARQAAAKKKS